MAFKLKSPGFASPCRATTPLHQNVSTNEVYSTNASGDRILNTTTTTDGSTSSSQAPGTPGTAPSGGSSTTTNTSKPRGKKKKYVGMENMCSPEYKAKYGSSKCDNYTKKKGTPDTPPVAEVKVIKPKVEKEQKIVQAPLIPNRPSTGTASNVKGTTTNYSKIGGIDVRLPSLPIDLPKITFDPIRYLRNLGPCKGGGCPKY